MNSYSNMIEEKLKGDTPRQKYESLCAMYEALQMVLSIDGRGLESSWFTESEKQQIQAALTKATEKSN